MSIELPRQTEWSVGARSETGYKRNENQDRMTRISTEIGDAYIVSDGMGGHKGGALAAQITVDTLQRTLAAVKPPAELAAAITQAFVAANAEVYRRAYAGDPATHGMGATALLLLTLRSSAIVAHVGDSRSYLLRDDKLRLLTKDHTRVQRMVDAGILTEEQANRHPDSGVLERAIGHQADVEVEISEPIELDYGDEILLCSDGLSSYVEHAQIEKVLAKRFKPAEKADELIALALASGGHDNVTVQVIRYEGGMNERKRQILTYQLVFLPLAAIVAAATAYGVDYMNRSRVATDKSAAAVGSGAAPAKSEAVTAPPAQSKSDAATGAAPQSKPTAAQPRANADSEQLMVSFNKLKAQVDELSKRVKQLENPGRAPGAAPTSKRSGSGDAAGHAKGAPDSRAAKQASDGKSQSGASATPAVGSAHKSATAAANTQNAPGASQSMPGAASQTSAPAEGAGAASQSAAAASSDAKSGAKPDAAARAGPVSASAETAK